MMPARPAPWTRKPEGFGTGVTRGGRSKDRDDPERKCVVTGEVQPKHGLLRFVIGPGDVVVADVAEKLPGRGIWVAADRATLEEAVRRNAFSRVFARRKVF